MKRILTAVTCISSFALCAVPASAQSYNKRDPHFNNVPGCPANSNITVNTDKFSDGTPLPSCGGRVVSGTRVTTWKMVWTGTAWATVGGTTKVVDTPPPPPPSVFSPPSRRDVGLRIDTINSLPHGHLGAQDVYLYQGNWVTLVAAGGGNYTTKIIAAGGGNLVAAGGGNIVSTNGGNILLNGGANITRYTQAMRR